LEDSIALVQTNIRANLSHMNAPNIWQRITSYAALLTAFEKVRDNGGVAGGDGVTIAQYAKNLTRNLAALSEALQNGTYIAGLAREVYIPKRVEGFRRLTIPPVEDRIVHTAIATMLSPILEMEFEEASFAYRPGRSVKQAVAAIERWREEGYVHVIEADIDDYFDHVIHEKLLVVLAKCLRQVEGMERILPLIARSLAHQAEQLGQEGLGLVQGSPLSPLLANLYLDVLDEEIAGKGIRIVRFADDFVILCKSEKLAQAAFEDLKTVLTPLGLTLNPEKTRLVDFDKGFEFLGQLFVRSFVMPRKELEKGKPITQPIALPASTPEPIVETHDIEQVEQDRTDFAKGERVLYVLDKGRRIAASHQQIIVLTAEENEVLALPIHAVDRIVVGVGVKIDESLISHVLANGIETAFINGHGETLGRLQSLKDQHGALQFLQARKCDDVNFCTVIVRSLVDARIRNQRTQLFRLNRRSDLPLVTEKLTALHAILRKLPHANNVNEMRGHEGNAGRNYWPALGALCEVAAAPFKRSRPAQDPVNAVINFLTALLERDIRAAIKSTGLHIGFGFLHVPQDRGDALVYDLMEPFRAPLTEGLAVFLFNSHRIKLDMFTEQNGKLTHMNSEAQRAIISGYENYIAKRVNLTGSTGKLAWRRLMERQALDLAKAIRKNDPSLFKPYLMEA
jgi:CRISPR-associated protein Cas1